MQQTQISKIYDEVKSLSKVVHENNNTINLNNKTDTYDEQSQELLTYKTQYNLIFDMIKSDDLLVSQAL